MPPWFDLFLLLVSPSFRSGRVRVQERLGDRGEQGGVLPLQRDRPGLRAARRHHALRPRRARRGLLRQRRPRPLRHGGAPHDQRPPRRLRAGPVARGARAVVPVGAVAGSSGGGRVARSAPALRRRGAHRARRPGGRRAGAGSRSRLGNLHCVVRFVFSTPIRQFESWSVCVPVPL